MYPKRKKPSRSKPKRIPGHVFVSYAHEDVDRVRLLVERLASRGLNIWWDKQIEPGTRFRSVIEEKLYDAACVVVVWSIQSVKKDFVRSEADIAMKRGILVPVLFDVKARIPVGFTELQYLDLTVWQGKAGAEFRQLVAGVRKLLKRSGGWQDYGTLIDDDWVVDQSKRAARELRQVAEKIGVLGEILASETKASKDVVASLDEVHDTYDVVSEAIDAFVEAAVLRKTIDTRAFMKLERGRLRRLIANGRGHCTRIATYYGRQGGLRDWLESRTTARKLKQADEVFGRLSTADGDFFADLARIGEVLTNESRAIVNLLLMDQEKAVQNRIIAGRKRLQPLEKELEKGISALELLERRLGYVRGKR
jgi:hypothetical protein